MTTVCLCWLSPRDYLRLCDLVEKVIREEDGTVEYNAMEVLGNKEPYLKAAVGSNST